MSEKKVESEVLNAFGVDRNETDTEADSLTAETMKLYYEEYATVVEAKSMAELKIGRHLLAKFFDNDPQRVENNKFCPYKDKSWQKVKVHADWPWKSDTAMRNLLRLAIQDRWLTSREYEVNYGKVKATHLVMLLRVPKEKLEEKIKLLDKIQAYADGTYPTKALNAEINKLNPKTKWTRPAELLTGIASIKSIIDGKFTDTFMETINRDVDDLSEKQKTELIGDIEGAINKFRDMIKDLNEAKKALRYKKPKPKHEDKPQPGMAA
jgi:hypothetical protein